MVFKIASSPYTHNQRSTSRIMLLVTYAALPGIAALCFWFGWGSLIQIALGILSAVAAEALVVKLRKQSLRLTLGDNSAALTGLLLGISLPPLAPWWMIILGTVFAVIIAKQLYGGLGHNPFNPAMVGYVVLLIAFPVQMTSWLPPQSIAATVPGFTDVLHVIFTGSTAAGDTMTQLRIGVDGISQATPLDTFKTGIHAGRQAADLLNTPIYGGVLAGLGWQWVNVAFMAVARHYPLAYSGQFPADADPLRHARLAACAGKMRFACGASFLRRDDVRSFLYSYRPGYRLDNQPRAPAVWRAGRFAGLADPHLGRLSRRGGLCGAAGEHHRAAN